MLPRRKRKKHSWKKSYIHINKNNSDNLPPAKFYVLPNEDVDGALQDGKVYYNTHISVSFSITTTQAETTYGKSPINTDASAREAYEIFKYGQPEDPIRATIKVATALEPEIYYGSIKWSY